MLKELLNKGYYSFHDSFDNWEEAVRESYRPLLKEKIINDIFIENVISCIKKYGPYIVIVPGIAMPHSTERSDGCFGTAISLMIVKKDVVFDRNDIDKNAKIFFSLASLDHDKHLNNIKELMNILTDNVVITELMNINSAEELNCFAIN